MGVQTGSLAWWGHGAGSVLGHLNRVRVDKVNLYKNSHLACSMSEAPCEGNDMLFLSLWLIKIEKIIVKTAIVLVIFRFSYNYLSTKKVYLF